MAIAEATTIREFHDKLKYLVAKIDQQAGSSLSTPRYGYTDSFGMPPYNKIQELQMYPVQGPKIKFLIFVGCEPDEWMAQCESIFELYNTSETQKSIQVTASLKMRQVHGIDAIVLLCYSAIKGHPP
jgi:hypothetical protein